MRKREGEEPGTLLKEADFDVRPLEDAEDGDLQRRDGEPSERTGQTDFVPVLPRLADVDAAQHGSLSTLSSDSKSSRILLGSGQSTCGL